MRKLLLIVLFIIPLISANGLFVNQSSSPVTKVYNQDVTYSYSIFNQENFPFYNVSVESNSFLNAPKIPEIAPGAGYNVNGIIFGNENTVSKIRVKGFYFQNIGVSNKTYNLTVDYYDGVSRCDFTIIKGDKVVWRNLVSDEIVMRNTATNQNVAVLQFNQTYTTNFNSPEIFSYVFLRRGFVFTPICTITTLSDSGLVNNPELDGFINLTLNIIFNPTSIGYNIIEKNYTIDSFASQEGILTITNTGNNTAKNIILSGQWMSFNTNNFDLERGQTKGIIYTFRPLPTKTSETNMTYTIPLTITGNFPSITENFKIFVPYASIGNATNQTSNYQSLLGLLQQFCKDNPNENFCKDKPTLVYVGNGTDASFNVSYSQEQVKALYSYFFQQGDENKVFSTRTTEKLNLLDLNLVNLSAVINNMSNTIQDLQKERVQSESNTTFLIIFFVMLAIGIMLILLIVVRIKHRRKALSTW